MAREINSKKRKNLNNDFSILYSSCISGKNKLVWWRFFLGPQAGTLHLEHLISTCEITGFTKTTREICCFLISPTYCLAGFS